MQPIEARQLRKGERVEVRLGRTWVSAIVEEVKIEQHTHRLGVAELVRVVVRRWPVVKGSRRAITKIPDQVRLVKTSLDCPTGNVYADWLDEQGEHKAAGMLRKEFPISDGVPPNQGTR